MSSAAINIPAPSATRLPGRRYDRVFFPVLSALMLATVLFGFAKTYFLAGMIHAPLPSWIIHVHGALFSSWIILFIVQTGLVAGGRVDLHRKLGLFGFGLSVLMVSFGLLAATNSLRRGSTPVPGLSAQTFYVVPVVDMIVFATMLYFGYRLRSNSPAHKRLMLIATIALLDAAVGRWPIAIVQHNHVIADLCVYAFLFAIMLYDLWSTHRVQRVTLWASAFLIVMQQIRIPLAFTPAWQHFAAFMAGKS